VNTGKLRLTHRGSKERSQKVLVRSEFTQGSKAGYKYYGSRKAIDIAIAANTGSKSTCGQEWSSGTKAATDFRSIHQDFKFGRIVEVEETKISRIDKNNNVG
jgi:hypothetical protein